MIPTLRGRDVPVGVVLFSGGRGSGALARQLVSQAGIDLTLAINGYDDGASTGEVRRFLGDSLGPSDFRKNASRLAGALQTCPPALIEWLDGRLPAGIPAADALASLEACIASAAPEPRAASWLRAFLDEYARTPDFDFGNCSRGNLVFAGAYLCNGRDFNRAVDAYCGLVGLRPGLIENVTDGTPARLVALDASGRLLRTEEGIVDARHRNHIREIFLVDAVPTQADASRIESLPFDAAVALLMARAPGIHLNPRLAAKIAAADVIIYAPGTQHSSLFPSYLTLGLAGAIAGNLRAVKLLITNIQTDAEISGSTAVDLIGKALYYLSRGSAPAAPTPCLITHYLVNEPGRPDAAPYVPPGPVDASEDPRLFRIADYEDGVTGQHDARRVLEPFLHDLLSGRRTRRVALLLHDGGSFNKIAQTLLELVRGSVEELPLDLTVFSLEPWHIPEGFAAKLPFSTRTVADVPAFLAAVRNEQFDYVGLFESSGMYRGEDVVTLASHLSVGRLDGVWGSRRLSVRDIQASYRLRYRRNAAGGVVSYLGSHVLSLSYLLLYGRYISDTLSGVWVVRAADALAAGIDITSRLANQYVLSGLLRRRADVLELPVRFVPMSPQRVRRTSVLQGLHALVTLISLWL